MAFGESFSPYPKFDEQEVFEAVGRPETIKKLKPSNFEGPVAHWANDRMRMFGETIIPRQVYVEQPPYKRPHRVAWVYHDGFDVNTGESFQMHHIACDCSGEIDRVDDPEEKQRIMDSCPALLPVIEKQADLVNATYGVDLVLAALPYYGKTPMEEQSPETQHFVTRSIVYMLEHDYRHPESWIANVESGWTLINLMAKIFKIKPEDIEWLAEALATQEVVETDGVVISLSQKLKDTIDADKVIREVAKIVEESLAA